MRAAYQNHADGHKHGLVLFCTVWLAFVIGDAVVGQGPEVDTGEWGHPGTLLYIIALGMIGGGLAGLIRALSLLGPAARGRR